MTQEKIDEIFKYLIDVMKQTGDLAKQELPLVAKEVVNYELFSAILWCVYSCIFISAGFFCVRYMLKKIKTSQDNFDLETFSIVSVVIGFMCLGTTIFMFHKYETIIKCCYSPRLVIFEKLKSYSK